MVVRKSLGEACRTGEDPRRIGAADPEPCRICLEFLRRHAPPSGFASALDLGCGESAFGARLASLARRVTRVDLSGNAAAGARSLPCDPRRIREMDLPARSFDLVVCGAGYNAFWEIIYFNKEAAFEPVPRRFEDQYRRVRECQEHYFDENGADQLVDLILGL